MVARICQERFRAFLRAGGHRFTPERRAVLRQAFSLHHHFEADELLERLRRRGAKTSKATVYRTLALLVEAGLLREVHLGEKHVHYEHLHHGAQHDHLICLGCGKVIEFEMSTFERMQERICRKYGFATARHYVSIRGFCADCQAKGKTC